MTEKGWTDTHSAITVCVFIVCVYMVFFSPVLRYDGILYMAPARSLLINGNLNTYNESYYYTIPGWDNVTRRVITGRRRTLVSYVYAQDYTPRGYRHVVFPIGNPMTWLPSLAAAHILHQGLQPYTHSLAMDGFSFPYRIALGWWSFLIGAIGILLAYRVLRTWYDPFSACFASLFVVAAGNLIPFITHDVTFSHGIDFMLINAILLLFLAIRKQSLARKTSRICHILWGMLIGWVIIVRYQDVALLAFPVCFYGMTLLKKPGQSWRNALLFLISFLFVTGLQLTYWKILYGRFIVSGQLMGTSRLASFNPLKPQIIPMLFSRYHGLYNWMPWMLLLTIAALLIIKRDRQFGILFVLVMVTQFYYNATRSEWWNLGFSVRRFSGWSIFFMLGAAEISTMTTRAKKTVGLLAVSFPIVFWAWLFKIHFLMRSHSASIFPEILGGAIPFHHDNFRPVFPTISNIKHGLEGLPAWFAHSAWTASVIHGFTSSQTLPAVFLTAVHLAFPVVLSAVLYYFFTKHTVSSLKIVTVGLAMYAACFYAFMIVSDVMSEDILVHRIEKGKPTGIVQTIRVADGQLFEGENSIVVLSDIPVVFRHPGSDVRPVAYCLIGLEIPGCPDTPAVTISLSGNDTVLARKTLETASGAFSNADRLDNPWGDAVYYHDWYRFKVDFSSVEGDQCVQWEISASAQEHGVVLGAIWHIKD